MARKLMMVAIPKAKGKPVKVIKTPRTVELRIRILHEERPDADGRWAFVPVFPRQGTSDFRIRARKPETAKRLLEDYVYNELAGRDEITAADIADRSEESLNDYIARMLDLGWEFESDTKAGVLFQKTRGKGSKRFRAWDDVVAYISENGGF